MYRFLLYDNLIMLRTNVYLTEEQEREISLRAAMSRKSKAVVIRDLIEQGLKVSPVPASPTANAFVKLGKIAGQLRGKVKGPKDLSQNIDTYLWDEHE